MIRLDVSENTIDIIKEFCELTHCDYCPFGDSGYLTGYKCYLEKPSEWDYEVEDE